MLNDTRIRSAKPSERDYKLTDFDGLYLLVRSNGSKLWRFAYRFDGKQKQIALGAYPEVTLAEARDRREASRKLLAAAKDPSLERRLEKIAKAAGGNSFREVAEESLGKQRREGRSDATLSKNRWLLEPAFAAFGDRAIGEVTAPELLHALRKFELRERYESRGEDDANSLNHLAKLHFARDRGRRWPGSRGEAGPICHLSGKSVRSPLSILLAKVSIPRHSARSRRLCWPGLSLPLRYRYRRLPCRPA
jgi:Arm DNA-binding domain